MKICNIQLTDLNTKTLASTLMPLDLWSGVRDYGMEDSCLLREIKYKLIFISLKKTQIINEIKYKFFLRIYSLCNI